MRPLRHSVIAVLSLAMLVSTARGATPTLICRDLLLATQPTPYADREIKFARTGQLVLQVRQVERRVELEYHDQSIAFGPNSKWVYLLISGSDGNFVQRWNTATLQRDPGFSLRVGANTTAIAASVDDTEIAAAGNSMLKRYALRDKELIATSLVPDTFPPITQLLYTENANHLIVAGANGTVNVNGLGRKIKTSWGYEFEDDYLINAMYLLPPLRPPGPNRHAFIGGQSATPEMVDELNRLQRATQRTLRKDYRAPVSVAASYDGSQFTVVYADGTGSVFNSRTGNQVAFLDLENKIARSADFFAATNNDIYVDAKAAYSSDDSYIVTTHRALIGGTQRKQQVSLWDGQFGTLIRSVTLGPHSHVAMLEHPALVRSSPDGSLHINDFARDRPLHIIEGGGGKVTSVVGTPDGKWLYTLTSSEISAWDLKAGKHHKLFADPNLVPQTLALSPDAKHLVVTAKKVTGSTGPRVFLFQIGK